MPAKNRIKTYVSNSYYHVYNRGVDKGIIFKDKQDYNVFLSYLKTYLLVKDIKKLEDVLISDEASPEEKNRARKGINLNNFYRRVSLSVFCLMSNHFHFLLKQKDHNDMDVFMNSLCTRYSMYFNRKHNRVGPLFQGVYKAVLINNDEQLIYVSRYIHCNPISVLSVDEKLCDYNYSSYPNYCLKYNENNMVDPAPILGFFEGDKNKYMNFIENDLDPEDEIENHFSDYLYIE